MRPSICFFGVPFFCVALQLDTCAQGIYRITADGSEQSIGPPLEPYQTVEQIVARGGHVFATFNIRAGTRRERDIKKWEGGNSWRSVDSSKERKDLALGSEGILFYVKDGHQIFRWDSAGGKPKPLDGTRERKSIAVDPNTNRCFMVKAGNQIHEVGGRMYDGTREQKSISFSRSGGKLLIWKSGAGNYLWDITRPYGTFTKVSMGAGTKQAYGDYVFAAEFGKVKWWDGNTERYITEGEESEFSIRVGGNGLLYMLRDNSLRTFNPATNLTRTIVTGMANDEFVWDVDDDVVYIWK